SRGGLVDDWTWEYYRRAQNARKEEEGRKKAQRETAEREKQEAIAAEAERIEREEREQRERKEQIEVARARLILSREQSERDALQQEVLQLQELINAYRIQLASEAQLSYTLAQEQEIADVMMIVMMDL
ncbi:MAG TPA: hypothetical protein PL001_02865, partial [Candidatus Kryptobacter bacterium]|nr:hypothetical protein [Candidatus Kryptobacter bacterium]